LDVGTLLDATPEQLLNIFCRVQPPQGGTLEGCIESIAGQLGLTMGELLCGVGFNPQLPGLPDVLSVFGLGDAHALFPLRDRCFCEDIYRQTSLDSVLALHTRAAEQTLPADALQDLLPRRLATIEAYIDRTVHAPTIERYRNEVRSLYRLGLARLEFFEARLARRDAGFRALVNEVLLAAETRLVPVGVLLYRSDILPREKLQLVRRGLVPQGLLAERLACPDLPPEERELLAREMRLLEPG
jgi:hypothetical protein